MSLAHTLMIQGTASTVGKSTLVTGLCRLLAREGFRVAPFKAQNMALNSFVTKEGAEIGRAQAVQAEAAGIEPTASMNPVLLKPEGRSRSQVIVMGRPLASLEAQEYYRNRAGLLTIVERSLATLRAEYDIVLIEGAGSPVELNLASNDIVNMAVARLADAPVVLVGDIDRGGIFASLLGTLNLLKQADWARVKGLVVNKFRGDIRLWHDGAVMLEQLGGVPVLGTVPMYDHIKIAEEDAVALDEREPILKSGSDPKLQIVVVRLPYLSNYDEFDALAAHPDVHLSFAGSVDEFPIRPDLIILPGTKNTLSDLGWLWRTGLAQLIRQQTLAGAAVLGICGGYQMLGQRVQDYVGAESEAGTVEPGLNLLPVETFFAPRHEKVTLQSRAHLLTAARRGLFANVSPDPLKVYQIHMGRTLLAEDAEALPAFEVGAELDGISQADGWWVGCYLHGLFENVGFTQAIVAALQTRRGNTAAFTPDFTFDRQTEYDKLADHLQTYLDIARLKNIIGL